MLILLLTSAADAQEQHPDSLMVFEFVKTEEEILTPGSYFNVLKIINNDSDLLEGLVRFSCPDGWQFIGPHMDSLRLLPGQSRMIPIRISIPKNTIGGISFVLGAELFGEDLYNYANSYVSIARNSWWDMHLENTQVYLSEFRPYGDMRITLNNKGNSNELIKLSFDVGGLLKFREPLEADSFLYVALPAYEDTTLGFQIRSRDDLKYAELQSMKNNWWAHSINIRASTVDKNLYGSVRTTSLASETINDLPTRNSPVNTEVTLYNLISDQRKKMSARVYGKVLFPENQQMQYSLGFFNFYFDPDMNRNLDLAQQLRYMVKYDDPTTMVWVGDRLGVGDIHTLTGRGVQARHQIGEDHTVSLNVVQNTFSKNIGGHIGYAGYLGKVNWNTGGTVETTTDGAYGHYSVHLGGTYKLLQRHTLSLQTVTSLNNFSAGNYLTEDRSALGLAYRFSYRYNDQRMMLSLDNTNTRFSYLRNSGINRSYFSGRYLFSDKFRLFARYQRNYYTSTRYPYNFLYPANYNINEHARILLSYNQGNITYQGGPNYSSVIRRYYNPSGDYWTTYSNYQPGLMGSVAFRVGNMRSITPNLAVQSMHYRYGNTNPEEEMPEISSSWRYTVGVNYYDHAFKFTAYYSSGDASELYRSVVIEEDPALNQSFHVRPYYERYFNKEKVRLSAFLNYSYYSPSLRENMLMNLTSDFFLQNSWNFYLSFNVYQVSRTDADVGRVTTRDVNLMVGMRKAFDIQQPRLAYYDLTIVGFNDLDGDGVKDDNEKPISNVLINISRDPDKNMDDKTGFAETNMITDPQGEVSYENIPEGIYDLSITPLSNLENLYFLHGEKQSIHIVEDMVHYLPLVESYKVMGRIIIDRDPNTNEGVISAEGIRVTATSETGETYSTLSTSFGTYVLDLPKSSSYEINIYNVFGENFRLERGSYRIQFTENRTINLDFRFIERRRAIQFDNGEQFFQFNLDRSP